MAAPLCRRACTSAVIFTRNLRMPTYPTSPRLHNYAKESNIQARINGPLGKTSLRSYSRIIQEVPDDSEDDVLYKKVLIEVKGHDTAVLNSYETFVSMAARELDVNITEIKTPPRVIERYTQLKSVHIYKKHRVQYETRTHFRSFTIKHVTGSTADTFLEYIQRNLPEGMAMKVTKNRIEALPDHLHPPQQQVTEGTL